MPTRRHESARSEEPSGPPAAPAFDRWADLLDVIESAVVVTDVHGVVTFWSRGAEALYGWTRAEAEGRSARELLKPDEALAQRAWSAYRQGETWAGDVELAHRDGTRFTAWASVSPLSDPETGGIASVVGISRDVTAEREALLRLRSSEERFEQLADHLPVLFWMTDIASGAILYASPAYETIWGRPIEELYADPRSYREAIHPQDRPRVERILTGRRSPGDLDYRIVRPDGSIRWIHDFSYPVVDADGRAVRFAGIATDVTTLKASERELAEINESLRESESRFTDLAEHIDAVFWLVEPDTDRLLYVSPSVERIFGITGEEMGADGERYWSLVHPDDRDHVRGLLEHPETEVEVEYRLVRPDGRVIWINDRSFPIRDESGRVRRLAGIGTDITARHETEADRLLLAAAVEQTSDGMLLLDRDAIVRYANPAIQQITGYPADQLVGVYPRQLIDALEGPGLANVADAVTAGTAWSGLIHGTRPDGAAYDGELTIWPLEHRGHSQGTGDSPRNVVVVLRDLTDLRAAERALVREQEERAAIAEALGKMRPAETLEATADSVAREIRRLAGVQAAGVIAFEGSGAARLLAIQGPDGAPVRPGMLLPPERAGFVRDKGHNPGPPEAFAARTDDGEMGRAWIRLGVTATVWVPLRANDKVVGVIPVSTTEPDGVATLERLVPALNEYAVLAGALLGGQLAEHNRIADARRRIHKTIMQRQFQAVFQPVVELGSGTIVGYEALTRFTDGLSPDLHFREAAAAGLGVELETAALRAAQDQCLHLPATTWLSINVSPDLVLDGAVIREVMENCNRRLVLEVTEHTVVSDYETLRRAVAELNHGARLAVDDAGAGFASLRHIIELRPDFVKLDIGLVRGVDGDAARQSIVAGMVHFAATTGCVLIAEGVETEEERQALIRLGLTFGQGYLFGRPAPAQSAPCAPEPMLVA